MPATLYHGRSCGLLLSMLPWVFSWLLLWSSVSETLTACSEVLLVRQERIDNCMCHADY
jgi:hypothetical protein